MILRYYVLNFGILQSPTAIVVLLFYCNSTTMIQGYFSKKFTQSVFEFFFQSVMCFSHVLQNQMYVHIRPLLQTQSQIVFGSPIIHYRSVDPNIGPKVPETTQRRSDTFMCAIYCMVISIHFYIL